MKLLDLLKAESATIVAEATQRLLRSRLKHYAEAGADESRERLQRLFDLLLESLQTRNLAPVMEHSAQVAVERYNAGFDIQEVQAAINALEEATWRHVVQTLPPEALAESIGLLTTVLGAAKDALARKYVELASQHKSPSLNLSALFKGTPGV